MPADPYAFDAPSYADLSGAGQASAMSPTAQAWFGARRAPLSAPPPDAVEYPC